MMLYVTAGEEVVKRPPRRKHVAAIIKRHQGGISHSSCSDGLSVGSYEMDDDSSSGHHHSHDHDYRGDLYNGSEPPPGVAPLSHSAARHKMAVRPRRTHGAPRRNKPNSVASALPITPELNEETIRSTTPEVIHKITDVVTESSSSSTTTKHHVIVREQQQQINRELQRVLEPSTDVRLKSSSLPPGLALSQLTGQAQAGQVGHVPRLSVADSNTPRSSIKRSKSSSQGQSLRDSSPKPNVSQIAYHSEERIKYRSEKKYAEETCHEKKSKSDKKNENEAIRSSKKEESFFSRLLLRKSGKKSKKDHVDGESQLEVKKTKTEKTVAQYKPVDNERRSYAYGDPTYKPVPAERTHKTAGQKAFANQMHKRIDNKGSYVHDGYKDVYSAAKIPGVEYNITDLKIAEETDKMLNAEMRSRFSRRDEYTEKIERSKRSTSKEMIEEKRETCNLHQEKAKRPSSITRTVDPFSSKAFISNEVKTQEENSPGLVISDEEPHRRNRDFMFYCGNNVKTNYSNPNVVAVSTSPPKTIRHQSSENIKYVNRTCEHITEYSEKKRDSTHRSGECHHKSGIRCLGDEFSEARSSIGKSHSFRYASETASISSQENQMPSLPAIVGISEPLLESWEANYRRNVTSDRYDISKRVSARNYNILHGTPEANYDSLPSTDSSYLDSLKTDINDDRKLFTSNLHITIDTHKRDSDISQIEAKIDDIISCPKPIITSILKSSSLDSVKSSPEKPAEDRRKTISVESALSQSGKVSSFVQKDYKKESESFISVTVINNDQKLIEEKPTSAEKLNKSDEKIQKSGKTKSAGVPEFLNIQLNKVDAKPTTHVVLTANVTPKKIDSPQAEPEQEFDMFKVTETRSSHSVQTRKEIVTVHKVVETVTDSQSNKTSPDATKKTTPTIIPQSPSTPKGFFKRKSASVEHDTKPEKPRTNSLSTDGSTEKIYDTISIDQKSHSSFGSKSSIQSTDSNETRTPDRQDEAVIYRKKPVMLSRELRGDKKNDDEPELMKVFARRSLKIKDTEADSIAQDIAEAINGKVEPSDNNAATKSKNLKNEFNASIKSRDSDKENDDNIGKEQNEEKRTVDIAARVSQFGAHYQRSISINSVSNSKRESTPNFKSEVNKYKKEVSDSTPEKRLRNRTFPDSSNERDEKLNIAKTEAMAFKADTLTKRPWQKKDDDKIRTVSVEMEKRESAVIEKDVETKKDEGAKEKDGAGGEADGSPQFKGILQMRAEWERRAKQGMTK